MIKEESLADTRFRSWKNFLIYRLSSLFELSTDLLVLAAERRWRRSELRQESTGCIAPLQTLFSCLPVSQLLLVNHWSTRKKHDRSRLYYNEIISRQWPGVKLGGSHRISAPPPQLSDPPPWNTDPAPFCWDPLLSSTGLWPPGGSNVSAQRMTSILNEHAAGRDHLAVACP